MSNETLREALENLEGVLCAPDGSASISGSPADLATINASLRVLRAALSQPMPEAAAQGATVADLQRQMREVAEAAYKTPGVAVKMPELVAVEGRKFMRGEPSLFDQLPFGEMQSVTAMLSASTAAPEVVKPEREIEQLIRERDQRDEIIDRLCDAVLGSERPEWSSAYGFDDAVEDVEERITQLHQPSVDKAWKRFEQANAAQPQPQATEGEHHPQCNLNAKTRYDGKCDCSAQHQAQGEPEVFDTPNMAALGLVAPTPQEYAAELRVRWQKKLDEALAQHRAALEKCVGALEFYAGGSHFTMHDPDAWDTVSGEPQNFYEDENNTATVEDGSIAKAAITEAERVLKGGGV